MRDFRALRTPLGGRPLRAFAPIAHVVEWLDWVEDALRRAEEAVRDVIPTTRH